MLLGLGFPVALLLAWAQESQGESQSKREPKDVDAGGSGTPRRDCSVAVLPFDDLSREGEFADVADGVPEDVLTLVAKRSLLDVTARNSSFAFKGTSPDIRQVGEALGVRFVLEGSIRRTADHVRVTGQLIETQAGAHVWSEAFDLPSQTWAAELERAVQGLAAGVHVSIQRAEKKRLLAGPLDALSPVQIASFAITHTADVSLTNLVEARTWLELALKKHPGDADANAAMARIKAWLPTEGGGDRETLWKEAADHLAKVREAGPPTFDIFISMGGAFGAMGQMAELETCSEEMRAIEPTHPAGWAYAATAHLGAGRWQELADTTAHGLSLMSRGSFFRVNYYIRGAIGCLMLEDFEAAGKFARNYLLARETLMARTVLVTALVSNGRLDQARREFEKLRELYPDYTLVSYEDSAANIAIHPDLMERLQGGIAKAGLEEDSDA